MEDGDASSVRVNRFGASLLGEAADFRGLARVRYSHALVQDDHEVPVSERPLQVALRGGKPVSSYECRLVRADGSAVEVMESAMPLFDEHGVPRGAMAAVVDISEREHAEEHQKVLLDELQHRVKNILVTITSLATRMLKTSSSLEEFAPAFTARLMAMSNMHDLLFQRDWGGAEMSALIGTALSAYATAQGRNIAMRGPKVLLRPDSSATLGMVLHELATNSAKYGALATENGRLEVSWRTEPSAAGERLHVDWTERGGPSVAPPDHEGFGTSFIKRSVEYELEGTVDLHFEPDGLRCAISFPLRRDVEGGRVIGSPGKGDGG